MSWERVAEGQDAVKNDVYRTTFFITGPYPNDYIKGLLMQAVRTIAHNSGRMHIRMQHFLSHEDSEQVWGSNRPYGTWAYRVEWKKLGDGTPLAFFMGPAGLLTLAIVGVLVLIVGALIVGREVERLSEELGGGFKDIFSPALVVALVVIVGLISTKGGKT